MSEILPYELSGNGDFFYIFFEKEKLNTMEVVLWICKQTKLKREQLGIAGLKDKEGITKQRISISQKYLKTCGGKDQFLKLLAEKVKILKTSRHYEPLAVGKNQGNHFEIRLRKREMLPTELKNELESKLEKSKESWFPNAFWIQRFGKGNKNFKKAAKLFAGEEELKGGYEVKFKLQAFGSMRFNEYVMKRREKQAFLLEGDIMVNGWNAFGTWVAEYREGKLQHFDYWKIKEEVAGKRFNTKEREAWKGNQNPLDCCANARNDKFLEPQHFLRSNDYNPDLRFPTGPVLWMEQLLARAGSEARTFDDWLIAESGFNHKGIQISERYQLYGFRRPLWVKAKNLEWKRGNSDLILSFSLPTGAYASVFLAEFLKTLDPKGCEANGLIIPQIKSTQIS